MKPEAMLRLPMFGRLIWGAPESVGMGGRLACSLDHMVKRAVEREEGGSRSVLRLMSNVESSRSEQEGSPAHRSEAASLYKHVKSYSMHS